jgi:RHS repeat-associated protein
MFNGHGDVTELRDAAGGLLNSYSYDIWGNTTAVSEKVSNSFRYSGELWDDSTDLQYLRARWYDPSQARFISEDTYEGDIANPLSQNLYTYVENNPLIYMDPSGHNKVTDTYYKVRKKLKDKVKQLYGYAEESVHHYDALVRRGVLVTDSYDVVLNAGSLGKY